MPNEEQTEQIFQTNHASGGRRGLHGIYVRYEHGLLKCISTIDSMNRNLEDMTAVIFVVCSLPCQAAVA